MKKSLSIHFILSFILLVLLGLMVSMILYAIKSSNSHKDKLIEKNRIEANNRLAKLISSETRSKLLILNDYTFWDDMVYFARNNNSEWANEHIIPMMKSYEFDFVLTYNQSGKLQFLHNNVKDIEISNLINTTDLNRILALTGSFHWFCKKDGKTYELFAATIHPTNDPDHLTKSRGILVLGNLINDYYLNNLSKISGTVVNINNNNSTTKSGNDDEYYFTIPLYDINNKEISQFSFSKRSDFLALYNNWSNNFITILIASVVLILLFYHFLIIKLVTNPLQKVSQILEKNSPVTELSKLDQSSREFKQLSEMIIKQIQQRQEIERLKSLADESDRLKTNFLANISHEIRTPINGIIGFSELLCTQDNTDNKPQFKEIIKSCSHDLMHIMDDIIELSKIDSGAIKLTPHHFSLATMFNELNSMYKHLIKSKSKSINLIIQHPHQDLVLFADGYRIKQMLNILLDNSLKFTENGHIELTYKLKRQTLTLKVKDSGIGIRKEKREMIFERFRQCDEKMDRHHGGNGLGLAILKKLADMMHAQLFLETETNKGTCITIVIPIPIYTEPIEIQAQNHLFLS